MVILRTLRANSLGSTIALVELTTMLVAFAAAPAAQQSSSTTSQQPRDRESTTASADTTDWVPWTNGRYRLTPGDVVQLVFSYLPEFDQTVSVQPDGYISLKSVSDVYAQGLTVPELQRDVTERYGAIMRDPVMTIVLKEFEKPYFIATGAVTRPGKFELRGATTVTQALALAGGVSKSAKFSQVVLFRQFSNDYLSVKTINAKKMYKSRDLSEDVVLRPGDTVFVPTSKLSEIGSFIPRPSLGFILDPAWLAR